MRSILVLFVILLGQVCFSDQSIAKKLTILGADDPRLRQAIDLWLDDNDTDSLPAMAALANSGNQAAQFLVARIESSDRAPSRFVLGLSRSERHDLYRPAHSSGLFRPGWLKIEADSGNALARILFTSTELGISIPGITDLIAAGEPEAVDFKVRKVAVDGTDHQRDILIHQLPSDHDLMPYLRAFRYARNGLTTGRAALEHMIGKSVNATEADDSYDAMRFVDIGYQAGDQTPRYGVENVYYDDIASWVMNAPAARSTAILCEQACPANEVQDCANLALGLVGGYYEAIRFDSPLETIIPQARFIESKRAVGMTRRKIASIRTEAGEAIFSEQEMRTKSNCLSDAIIRERAIVP